MQTITSGKENSISTDVDIEKSIRYEVPLKRYIREQLFRTRIFNYGKVKKLPKVMGFVGPWGSGKSISGAGVTILDYMVDGYTVFSNMDIRFFVRVGDMVAGYHTEPLVKADLFKLQLYDALLFVDEINIEFADSRRAISNKNLQFSKVIQLIRKRHLNMIYTVISEMYVDNRVRDMTSLFVKCGDILLMPGNLGQPFDFGERISWKVYDMMGILNKGSYHYTKEPAVETIFNAKRFWRTYDTDLVQGEGQTSYSSLDDAMEDEPDINMQINRAQYLADYHRDFSWLEDIVIEMMEDGRAEIPVDEIYSKPEVQDSGITQNLLTKMIRENYQIRAKTVTRKGFTLRVYDIPDRLLIDK